MGINICLVDPFLTDIKEWDSCRINADKEFIDILYSIENIPCVDDDDFYTPCNVLDLKNAIDKWNISKDW